MDTLTYKTPSPVIAKRRLSGIPVRRAGGLGPSERVVSEQVLRVQKEWPGLQDEQIRKSSLGNPSETLKNLKDETDSVDPSMGFRELERVPYY